MDDNTHTFNRLRPRLQKIAYRMLGTTADAEDIVQDAWLRWHTTAQHGIENPQAWLVSVTTRLSIDKLRAAKTQREYYAGIWLPEPQLTELPVTPEEIKERADDVSMAFLLLLERLTPEARAAFLLHEIFDIDYDQVAEILAKTQAACRQLVSRAKTQLRNDKPRHVVQQATHHRLLQAFAQVLDRGDLADINALLAEDALLMGDGGGQVPSFPQPLAGGRRIAQLFFAATRRYQGKLTHRLVVLNGQWSLLRFIDGQLESALMFELDGGRISRIYAQRNPAKLTRLAIELNGT
ncbi:RNA polymerase sigma-70 factor [Alcaligenaceae bacterium]|nr:RNA polymerase sigma-70 factor [Alcaligenaceae bacterium]